MDKTFLEVLKEHRDRYPGMEPQDYGKLVYQSEFGPGHMVRDLPSARMMLKQELLSLPGDAAPKQPEAVGGGLCRFPLSECGSPESVDLLADLFALTAQKHSGTIDGLLAKLDQVIALEIPGIGEWSESWRKEGFPSVHHSEAFRTLYHPHYRLLKKEYAGYFSALLAIHVLKEKKAPVLIGIDGRCGSGKTRLAALIGELFPCNCVLMDDFYLPVPKRSGNWKEIPGGNIDFMRLQEEIFASAAAGEEIVYRPYSCQKGGITEIRRMKPQRLTIIEGSYSHHPLLSGQYDLKIFLTCSKEEQMRRLKLREKEYFPVFKEQWMPLEEQYFNCFSTEESSDIRIDTSKLF